jgi:uncharacterized membrane protein (DUF106 family)
MLEALNNWCLYIMDFVMGWMLNLPRDVVLAIVAVLTAVILTGVRAFTTNQDFLKRCNNDKKRLGQLIKEAKARGDKEAVKRHKDTIQLIGMKSFKQEGLPLLASLIPIALIATWAFGRLAYLAPQPGQPITLKVDFPPYADGEFVALVKQEGLAVEGNDWVRQIKPTKQRFDAMGRLPVPIWPVFESWFPPKLAPSGERDPNNVDPTDVHRAIWKVTAAKSDKPYALQFRVLGEDLDHELIMDGKTYYSPVGTWNDNSVNLQMDLPEYKFLGFIPSIDLYWNKGVFIPLDAWLMGYLIIVIPLSFLLKPVMRIA